MRSRLHLFAAVGLVATFVDLGLFRWMSVSYPTWLADVTALVAAAFVSYVGNRFITFRGDSDARWVSQPHLFAATAVGAGLVDLAVVVLLVDVAGLHGVAAKVIAIAAAACIRWFAYRRILQARVRRDISNRRNRPPAEGKFRLSVVLPAYNEASRIASTISVMDERLSEVLGDGKFEIVVVDDGSRDATADEAEKAGARVIRQWPNQGKGAAVRTGMLAADGRAVVFTDSDLAYGPDLVLTILAGVEDGWDMVAGSRRHQRSSATVRARWVREIGGWFINRLTYLVLLGQFRDTQCGLKGFRGDIATAVFQRTRINGFAFDVELFLLAEQDHLSLLEIPVTVTNRPGSSVSLIRDSVALVSDLFRIRRWAGRGYYEPDEQQRRTVEAEVG